LAQASDLGMKPLIAHCNLALARNLHAAGEVKGALEHQTVAEKSYREMGMSKRLSL
jgi:hypothetical protein